MSIDYIVSVEGRPGATIRFDVPDTSAATTFADMSALSALDSFGMPLCGMLVQVETNPIRVCFGGTVPTQVAPKMGHRIVQDQTWQVGSLQGCKSLQLVNDAASAAAVLQITPFYEY